MNRNSALFSLVAAAGIAAAIAFWLQARSLKTELAEARAGKAAAPAPVQAPAPSEDTVPKKEFEAATARAGELSAKVRELETKLAEAEKAAARKPDPGKKDPSKPDGERPGLSKEMAEVLAKLGKTLSHGADIPEDAVKDLGLDEVQKAALQRAMEAEEKRLDDSMRRFYSEQVDPNASGTFEKTGQELILSMMGKMAPDLKELNKLPPEESQKIHLSSSIEEVLGPDKFLSKLAREVHGVRLKTYEDLAMALTPEQLAKVRDTYLREGSMYFKDMPLEFGLAPKDMKK